MNDKVGGKVSESVEGEEQGVGSDVKIRTIDERWSEKSQTGKGELGGDKEDISWDCGQTPSGGMKGIGIRGIGSENG